MAKQAGLDWDAIREGFADRIAQEQAEKERVQRERDEELARLLGMTYEELTAKPPAEERAVLKLKTDIFNPRSRKGVKQKKKRSNKPYRKYDWDVIAEMFDEGMHPYEIAEKIGCQYDTVYHALDKLGREYPPRVAGHPPKTHCQRGHDLSVHGVKMKQGGRYCRECRRNRERKKPTT